ncbi:nitroreductase family protein [Cyclobacteriaceae bacterium]|nr:nitroreductase family protein [Cyclobacteriaceae bacterium]
MNISAFNQMIASRRSIYPRDYKNEKIEDEIIWQILNNAHWAPTHKMTVPWRFKVYAGKGREELGRKQAEIYKKVALEEGNFLAAKYENLAKAPLRASHVIMIIIRKPIVSI